MFKIAITKPHQSVNWKKPDIKVYEFKTKREANKAFKQLLKEHSIPKCGYDFIDYSRNISAQKNY